MEYEIIGFSVHWPSRTALYMVNTQQHPDQTATLSMETFEIFDAENVVSVCT